MLSLQWGWGSQFSVQFLQIIVSLSYILFYLCDYWFLYSPLIFKKMKYSEKMNSLKKGEGVPLLNFEVGPAVPLLNFRGVPGPTFKSWGGSRVPGSRGPGSRGLRPTVTPCLHSAVNKNSDPSFHRLLLLVIYRNLNLILIGNPANPWNFIWRDIFYKDS